MVKLTIDVITLRTNLTTETTKKEEMKFDEKYTFITTLRFLRNAYTERTCEGGETSNIAGLNKILLKCYCNNGSIMNGSRKPIWFSSSQMN